MKNREKKRKEMKEVALWTLTACFFLIFFFSFCFISHCYKFYQKLKKENLLWCFCLFFKFSLSFLIGQVKFLEDKLFLKITCPADK